MDSKRGYTNYKSIDMSELTKGNLGMFGYELGWAINKPDWHKYLAKDSTVENDEPIIKDSKHHNSKVKKRKPKTKKTHRK